MGIAKRKFKNMLSLVHFNFPYYGEPNDGLNDEVGVISWSNTNGAALAGSEIPKAVTYAPKFGYRCLYMATKAAYITGTFPVDYLDLTLTNRLEIEFFMKPLSATISADDIVTVEGADNSYSFYYDEESATFKFRIGTTIFDAGTIDTSIYNHIKISINTTYVNIFVNGASIFSGTYAEHVIRTTRITLGKIAGAIDEFVIRKSNTLYGIGGDGKHGELNLTAKATTNINTVAQITNITNSKTFTIDYTTDTTTIGYHGEFTVGDELLIKVNLLGATDTSPTTTESGLYCIRKITSLSDEGLTVTVNKPITEFTFNNDIIEEGNYNYTVCLIPNYTSVTIGANATIAPRAVMSSGTYQIAA